MKKLFSALALLALLPLVLAQTPASAPKPDEKTFQEKPGSMLTPPQAALPTFTPPVHVDASAAIEKKDPTGKFQKMHAAFVERAKAGPIGVLFLGDSITEGWT